MQEAEEWVQWGHGILGHRRPAGMQKKVRAEGDVWPHAVHNSMLGFAPSAWSISQDMNRVRNESRPRNFLGFQGNSEVFRDLARV